MKARSIKIIKGIRAVRKPVLLIHGNPESMALLEETGPYPLPLSLYLL